MHDPFLVLHSIGLLNVGVGSMLAQSGYRGSGLVVILAGAFIATVALRVTR